MHPLQGIALDESELPEILALVEIPRGCKVKYELDDRTGVLVVDRVLHSSMHYPVNYGFLPKTLGEDGDALDVVILGACALVPGAVLRARIIGGFRMTDEAGIDDKIIAAPTVDPELAACETTRDLAPHVIEEIMDFFARYKALEGKPSAVGHEMSRDDAVTLVKAAAARHRRGGVR